MAFRAAVVGVGNVGSAYDRPGGGGLPRTHVGALLRNDAFDLVAICEPDPLQRAAFTENWNSPCRMFERLEPLLSETRPELLVVASPTPTHFEVLGYALATPPRVIFCEKPFCDSAEHARLIAEKARRQGTVILVDYQRRWDARITRLREAMARRGTAEYVQVVYRKGLFNYGAHAVNLLQFFFGEVSKVIRLGALETEEPSAELVFQSGTRARVSGVERADYELFDLDVFFRDVKYSLEFGGQVIREFVPRDGVYFPGYRSLVETPGAFSTEPIHGLTQAYREIARILGGDPLTPTCSADDALATLRVLEQIASAPAFTPP